MLDFSRALTQVRDICPKVPHLWDFSNRKSRTYGTFAPKSRTDGTFQIESPALVDRLFSPQVSMMCGTFQIESPAPVGLFKSKVPHL